MTSVAIGGTFHVLHVGHRALLKKAFQLGDLIYIGLTTDEMANEFRDLKVSPYEERKKTLKSVEEEHGKKITRKKFINNVPAFTTSFEVDESFYFVAVIKEKSLKHELTNYFELALKLPLGSLLYIWE